MLERGRVTGSAPVTRSTGASSATPVPWATTPLTQTQTLSSAHPATRYASSATPVPWATTPLTVLILRHCPLLTLPQGVWGQTLRHLFHGLLHLLLILRHCPLLTMPQGRLRLRILLFSYLPSSSVVDSETGSRIRCLFDPWIRDPE